MNDMSQVIIPKSDQVNAEDFLAGPRTYRIEGVDIRAGTEQPVSIHLAGEERVWRPCKSMSRVLVAAWGPDANVYRGRSVTLYRDPKVKWGGMEIGGIRISHMSHIDREMLLQLTATKGKRAPHIVKPLDGQTGEQQQKPGVDPKVDGAATWANGYIKLLGEKQTLELLNEFANSKAKRLAELQTARPELHKACVEALATKRASFSAGSEWDDADFSEGPDQSQPGEGFTDDADPPVYAATVETIQTFIEAAMGSESLGSAKDLLDKHREALPASIVAQLDKALAEKRDALDV